MDRVSCADVCSVLAIMCLHMGAGKGASTEAGDDGGMISRAALSTVVVLCLIPDVALAAEDKKKSGGGFVSIDTLTAQVTAANGRHSVMTVQSGIDVPDPALRTLAALVQPRLRDAYNRELQVYAAGMAPGALPNVDYLAQRMQQATDRVLGKPGGRWLIGGVMVN